VAGGSSAFQPERAYRGLLRLYPAEFRTRYSDEMVQLFSDQLRDARAGGVPADTARTWLRTLGDLAVTAASEHARRDRTVAHSLAASPSIATRALGFAGILGGAVLLAAFVVNTDAWDGLRILLFNLGAVAIVVAVHQRQASIGGGAALITAAAAILANLWYIAMGFLAIGNERPFAGDFGLVYFWAAMAMWLADAAFGFVTWRLGVAARWVGLALAVGSLFALTGIDRLELVRGDYAWFFSPAALTGVAVNGLGWILLGITVATRRRAPAGPGRPEGARAKPDR
jgi:hypothetical protein